MKSAQILVSLLMIFCRFALSQGSPPIQIVQATYGNGTQQLDVTASVQALIQNGVGNLRVGNHLFGKDPAFGKTKTLSVTFVSNGVQYRSEIGEGEKLSFVNRDQSVPASANVETQRTPRLAPDGTYFLTGSTSVVQDGALIGLHAGTPLKVLRDDGNNLHVAWGKSELDVDKRIVSNDLDVVEAAVARDQQGQAALANSMSERQEAINRQAEIDKKAALESSARQMEKTQPAVGSWSNSSANPLNRGAYNNGARGFSQHVTSIQREGSAGGSSTGSAASIRDSADRSAEIRQRETQRGCWKIRSLMFRRESTNSIRPQTKTIIRKSRGLMSNGDISKTRWMTHIALHGDLKARL